MTTTNNSEDFAPFNSEDDSLDNHPYVLRHTYATRLLREEGVTLVTVQATLGHESPATTAKYTQPSEEEQAAALEKLAIREQ